jgi:hypothetical protein
LSNIYAKLKINSRYELRDLALADRRRTSASGTGEMKPSAVQDDECPLPLMGARIERSVKGPANFPHPPAAHRLRSSCPAVAIGAGSERSRLDGQTRPDGKTVAPHSNVSHHHPYTNYRISDR